MKRLLLTLLALALFLLGCSGKGDKPVESRWRVLDTVEYQPDIDEGKLYVSLDEFEKLLFAPLFYFEKDAAVRGFSQELTYNTESVVDTVPRKLELAEKVTYGRDDKNDFHLAYINERNEGWNLLWKEGFLYKKLLGGDYVRTYSTGEHTFYKETLFRSIPDLYAIFRTHAEISSSGGGDRHVVVRFSDKEVPRGALPPKRYLQSSYGVEEMNNDKLIQTLAGKKFKNIGGTLDAVVTPDLKVKRLTLDLKFTIADQEVSFTVRGERSLSDKPLLEVAIPAFSREYHRRSFDAGKNIMEEKSNDPK
ncbi:MAG TPA: hypothetical protein PLV42_10420 [bacterium]|nr:hypothetical protein [bacterium]